MNWMHRSLAAVAVTVAALPAIAQSPIRTERVQFARGTSAATVRGTIRGSETVDYIVGARAGQTMTVALQTASTSAYFNVLPPGSDEAIFIGSMAGSDFTGQLQVSGDYRVRLYLMGAARRSGRAAYSLSVGVDARAAGAVGGTSAPVGSGAPVSAGNMPAFCRGEASQQYGVRPNYIRTGRMVANRSGSVIDGTADRGSNGITRFRCRFDARGRFIDVATMPSGRT